MLRKKTQVAQCLGTTCGIICIGVVDNLARIGAQPRKPHAPPALTKPSTMILPLAKRVMRREEGGELWLAKVREDGS
jgi:hypothetical protein